MKSISYYTFAHKGLSTFAKDILALIAQIDITTFGIQTFVDKVIISYNNHCKAQQRNKTNPLTVLINEADDNRDDCILALNRYLDSCKYDPDENIRASAKFIEDAIDRLGTNIYRMGQRVKSATILNIISESKQLQFEQATRIIDAAGKFSKLEDSQTAYDALIKQRASETDKNNFTLLETQKLLIDDLRSLIRIIDLQNQALENDELNNLTLQIDNLTSSDMASARISKSHKENNKDNDNNNSGDDNQEEPVDVTPTDETPTDVAPTEVAQAEKTPTEVTLAEDKTIEEESAV